jgi:hypothetical protein
MLCPAVFLGGHLHPCRWLEPTRAEIYSWQAIWSRDRLPMPRKIRELVAELLAIHEDD